MRSSLIFRVDFCIDFMNFTGFVDVEFSLASWMPTKMQEEEQAVAVKGIAGGPLASG